MVVLIWRICPTWIRQMVAGSNGNYLTVVAAYNCLACAIALPIAICRGEVAQIKAVRRKRRLVVMLFLNGFYDVCIALAVTLCAVIQYAIIANYLWPILLVVFLSAFRAQRLSRHALGGCLLGLSAVVVVLMPSGGAFTASVPGVALGVLAGLLWSSYSAMLGPEHDRMCVLIQGLAQGISGAAAFGLAVAMGRFNISDVMNPAALALICIFASVHIILTSVLWILVIIRHADVQRFACRIYILPVLSLVVSSAWFGNALKPRIWLAAPLLMGGLFLGELGR